MRRVIVHDVDYIPMPVPLEELRGKALKEKIAEVERAIGYSKAGLGHSSRARALSYREEIRELKDFLAKLKARQGVLDSETKRSVYIELVNNTYMVFYSDRKKYGRYAVAQFYSKDHPLEKVENWVRSQPNLILEKSTQDAVQLKTLAQMALARLPDVKELTVHRGNGYYYVSGTFKNGVPLTSSGIYVYRASHITPESFVNEILHVVDQERLQPDMSKPMPGMKSGKYGSVKDAKWKGTYSGVVKGKRVTISAEVDAPDGYVAGDKLREKFEKAYGTNYSYPIARFESGPKRLDPSSTSLSIARRAGPEEV